MTDNNPNRDSNSPEQATDVPTLTPPIRERARHQFEDLPENAGERAMVSLPAVTTLYQAVQTSIGIQALYNGGKISEEAVELHNEFANAYFEAVLLNDAGRELFQISDPEDTHQMTTEMKANTVAGEVDFLLEVSEHFYPDTEEDQYYNFLQSLEDVLEVTYVPEAGQ